MSVFKYPDGRVALTHELNTYDAQDDALYTVTYSIESYGHSGNGWDDPGEPAEVTIWEIIRVNDETPVDLNSEIGAKLSERIEEKLCEMVYLDGPPEPDYE